MYFLQTSKNIFKYDPDPGSEFSKPDPDPKKMDQIRNTDPYNHAGFCVNSFTPPN